MIAQSHECSDELHVKNSPVSIEPRLDVARQRVLNDSPYRHLHVSMLYRSDEVPGTL